MGEGLSHWSSMVLRKSQTYFFDRHTHPNSMYSNFCHVLKIHISSYEFKNNKIMSKQKIISNRTVHKIIVHFYIQIFCNLYFLFRHKFYKYLISRLLIQIRIYIHFTLREGPYIIPIFKMTRTTWSNQIIHYILSDFPTDQIEMSQSFKCQFSSPFLSKLISCYRRYSFQSSSFTDTINSSFGFGIQAV